MVNPGVNMHVVQVTIQDEQAPLQTFLVTIKHAAEVSLQDLHSFAA